MLCPPVIFLQELLPPEAPCLKGVLFGLVFFGVGGRLATLSLAEDLQVQQQHSLPLRLWPPFCTTVSPSVYLLHDSAPAMSAAVSSSLYHSRGSHISMESATDARILRFCNPNPPMLARVCPKVAAIFSVFFAKYFMCSFRMKP